MVLTKCKKYQKYSFLYLYGIFRNALPCECNCNTLQLLLLVILRKIAILFIIKTQKFLKHLPYFKKKRIHKRSSSSELLN